TGQLAVQPGPCVSPVLVSVGPGDAGQLRGFLDGEAGEVAEPDELGRGGVFTGEFLDRVVDDQQLIRAGQGNEVRAVQVHPLQTAAPFLASLAAGVVDEDAAHGLGSGGEEVAAAVPVLGLVHVHQPQVRLVD